MKNKSLNDSNQKFYYDMSLRELRNLNDSSYGKVSYNTTLYLNIISANKDCTASFIAQQIGVSKAAVTIRISELIEKGLVVKKQSPTDKRVNFLYIIQELKAEYDEYDKKLKELSEKIQTI